MMSGFKFTTASYVEVQAMARKAASILRVERFGMRASQPV